MNFYRRVGTLVALLFTLSIFGCAHQHIQEGDKLLKAHNFNAAIEMYEKALKEEPGNETAHDRIKMTRREAVRAELKKADKAL
ncbi:hypothetical protein KAI87_02190, partial [Myxococcota bacterium]|nr:hypothetical protein [Myxococcota bacterium]